MKTLIIFFLLSIGLIENPTSDPERTDYIFELTVITPGEDPATFDMVITGFTLKDNGGQTPFKLEKQDLNTPYKLNLKNGKYTAKINNRSKDVIILSKVQGIKNGERMSAGRSDSNHPILDFGIGGKFSVSDN